MHKKSHGGYFFLKVEIKDQNNQIVKTDAKKLKILDKLLLVKEMIKRLIVD